MLRPYLFFMRDLGGHCDNLNVMMFRAPRLWTVSHHVKVRGRAALNAVPKHHRLARYSNSPATQWLYVLRLTNGRVSRHSYERVHPDF